MFSRFLFVVCVICWCCFCKVLIFNLYFFYLFFANLSRSPFFCSCSFCATVFPVMRQPSSNFQFSFQCHIHRNILFNRFPIGPRRAFAKLQFVDLQVAGSSIIILWCRIGPPRQTTGSLTGGQPLPVLSLLSRLLFSLLLLLLLLLLLGVVVWPRFATTFVMTLVSPSMGTTGVTLSFASAQFDVMMWR